MMRVERTTYHKFGSNITTKSHFIPPALSCIQKVILPVLSLLLFLILLTSVLKWEQKSLEQIQSFRGIGTLDWTLARTSNHTRTLQLSEDKMRIQNVCRNIFRRHPQLFHSDDFRPFIVDRELNLALKFVPKCGSTTLLKILAQWHGMVFNRQKVVRQFQEISSVSRICQSNLTKVSFVRDPWQRLISAFRDKYYNVSAEHRKRFGEMAGRNSTNFTSFLEHVIESGTDLLQMNIHIRPQFIAMSFCHISYDFIGRLETMESDLVYLLQILGLPKDFIQTMAHVRENCSSCSNGTEDHSQHHENLLSSVDLDLIRRVEQIYQYDFEAFNYAKFIPHSSYQ